MTSQLFSGEEWLRYSRHIQQDKIGVIGQLRLKQAKIVVVGAGGLGCPVILYLVAAGVGQITVIDGDTVELSNLQRQILFSSADIGKSKAQLAAQRAEALNPNVQFRGIAEWLSQDCYSEFEAADIVVDCTDQARARYLINAMCVSAQVPWCYASVEGFDGQMALFRTDRAEACYACLFPRTGADPADCNSAGILGAVPGVMGSLQGLAVVKHLLGLENACDNQLLQWDLMLSQSRGFKLSRDPDCWHCGPNRVGYHPTYIEGDIEGDIKDEMKADKAGLLPAENCLSPKAFPQWQGALVDIRSETAHVAFNLGGENKPFAAGELTSLLNALDPAATILIYCETGQRSQLVVSQALSLGWTRLKSLEGGVQAVLNQSSILNAQTSIR